MVLEGKKEMTWPSKENYIPTDTSGSMENQTFITGKLRNTFYNQASSTKPDKLILIGYCIDLLEKLQEKLKYSYEVYLAPYCNYGSQDALTKERNGMVKEISKEERTWLYRRLQSTLNYKKSLTLPSRTCISD